MHLNEPTPRDLRLFGALLPAFFLLVGLGAGHRLNSSTATRVVWAAGAVVTVAYAAVPSLRRPTFVGWSRATHPVAVMVSHVLLTVVFVVLVTPIGVLLRLFGRDPLDRRADPSTPSYWQPRTGIPEPKRYLQQF